MDNTLGNNNIVYCYQRGKRGRGERKGEDGRKRTERREGWREVTHIYSTQTVAT